MDADQFAEDFDDAVGTNASRHIDRKTFARKLIDHRQTFQLLTIGAGVENKVVGPHVICPESRSSISVFFGQNFNNPWPLDPQKSAGGRLGLGI